MTRLGIAQNPGKRANLNIRLQPRKMNNLPGHFNGETRHVALLIHLAQDRCIIGINSDLVNFMAMCPSHHANP